MEKKRTHKDRWKAIITRCSFSILFSRLCRRLVEKEAFKMYPVCLTWKHLHLPWDWSCYWTIFLPTGGMWVRSWTTEVGGVINSQDASTGQLNPKAPMSPSSQYLFSACFLLLLMQLLHMYSLLEGYFVFVFFNEKYYTCLLYNISNRSMYCTYLTVHSIFVLCLGPDEMKLFFLVQICCSAVSVKQNRIQHTQPYEQLQRDAFGQINPLVDTHTDTFLFIYFYLFL